MAPTEEHNKRVFELHAGICRTLAHPKRLEILSLLRKGELPVGELAERMGVSLPNVSQHLAVLRDKGIVMTRRKGVNIYYQVAEPKIIQACDLMRDVLLDQLVQSAELAESLQDRSG